MTELGSSYNSGGSGAETFGSSLWYADALGAHAQSGHAVACRQALLGGRYALLAHTRRGARKGALRRGAPAARRDRDDPRAAAVAARGAALVARPDYWVALLWRRLMGQRVLDVWSFVHADGAPPTLRPGASPGGADGAAVTCASLSSLSAHPACAQAARLFSGGPLLRTMPPWLRAYAHCARRGPRGGLALLLLNLNASHAADVALRALVGGAHSAAATQQGGGGSVRRVEHRLWARSLRARQVRQGERDAAAASSSHSEPLRLDPTDGSTNLRERTVAAPPGGGTVRVHPSSILFVELPEAAARQCM